MDEVIVMKRTQLDELIGEVRGAFRAEVETIKADFGEIIRRLDLISEIGLDDKQVYTVEDVAGLLGIKPESVRKNYTDTGRIKASRNGGKRLEITRDEWLRVCAEYKRYGRIS